MKTLSLLKIGGLALSVSLLASCGQKNSPAGAEELFAGNIVGGAKLSASAQKEAGVVGIVIVTDDGMGICTGSLIDKRIVLTAAHCLDESEGAIRKMYAVFTPDISKATRDNVRAVVTGVANEAFAPSQSASWNDVALIKLSDDAPADFKLARLPSRSTDAALKAGVKATQMGFGKAEAARNPAKDTSGVLRTVSGITLLEKSADGKELHFDESKKGSCNGDSGGPAFIRDADGKLTQIGLDSRGNLTDSCLGTGIYTNVSVHLDWIRSHSAQLLAASDAPAPSSAPAEPIAPANP
jgi:secreted trypsin-like serine protease